MGSVNVVNNKNDRTVQIVDKFYGYQQTVSVDEYDAVLSYFKSVMATEEQAKNFAVSVFRVAQLSNTPVMSVLQQFYGKSAPQITVTMAYYLNSIRSASTLLGINVPTQPNLYVARNVRI